MLERDLAALLLAGAASMVHAGTSFCQPVGPQEVSCTLEVSLIAAYPPVLVSTAARAIWQPRRAVRGNKP